MNILGTAFALGLLLAAAPGARAQDESTGTTIISDQGEGLENAVSPGVKLVPPPVADDADASTPEASAAPASPVPSAAPPPVTHAELTDTRDTPGKIVAGKGLRPKTAPPGAGLLVDAKGRRLEVLPAQNALPGVPLMKGTAPLLHPAPAPAPDSSETPPSPADRWTWAVVLIGFAAAGALAFLGRRKV